MELNIIKTTHTDANNQNDQKETFVIDNNILYECNLTGTVVIPDGVIKISSKAFANKYDVTKVVLPEGIKVIETSAFLGCEGLEEINIPESVEIIEDQAFFGCRRLKRIDLPKNLKHLGTKAFSDTRLESVNLPKCPEYVGTYVFEYSKLRQVVIPIGFPLTIAMFNSCEDLETVTFEGTDIKVPDICFQHCERLKGINLNVIKTVGEGGFSNCKSLDFDVLPKDIRVKDNAFSECGIKRITVEDLNSIERAKEVFYGCRQLTEAVIEIRETNILIDAEEIPDKLFSHCDSLEKVSFTGLTGKIKSIGQGAFEYTALKEFKIPENVTKIGNRAFFKTKQLTEINLPGKIKNIGKQAFASSGLNNIEFPNSLSFVGQECFTECRYLEEITLPTKGFVISDNMFMNCTVLKKINNADKIVQVGKYAFYNTKHLDRIDLSSVADIGKDAFKYSGLTSVKLSKCCTSLGIGAFYECEKLKLADLSESSIESFPPYSFYQCMAEVILPNKIWNIGAGTFTGCYIKNLTILGQNVTIEESAFADAKIDTLTFKDDPDGQVRIDKRAFEDALIGELTIPDYLYKEYKNIWNKIK